ncbi:MULTISPECIES: penicillin-binding protein 2 [unclassified Kitasatospora]|uniref:peptidoglycan D,D-transpeptidase FtsI family protein n=1 Tax=unclassified Kitasatospora TaxID=2633591 RepID=UPI00070BAC3C|nr:MULTISPECIES: penicillin-binding protein 2 [unclassified Kitasatospora]KQV22225.1 penicillin-binding protein [Kitasatospora sp. Root107]KRB64622.1 penicillin-binding protein [Kitasatospora sp. Root187]
MNKPIRRVSIFCLVLVLALMVRVNWVQGVQAEAWASNPHNDRNKYDRYAYPRGNIIVAGGQPITRSDFVNGYRYKYKRAWVDGPLWAPVTGYSSQAYTTSQLESLSDGILSGSDSRLFFRNTLDMLTGKEKQGGDVVTTLNAKAQKAAYDALGSKKGAAVAIDPRTGAILALVSTPSYDPGRFAGTGAEDEKAWNELNADPNKPMLNRALRETYPPGSTFKLVTAAAAFESGRYQNIEDVTDTPQRYVLPNTNVELKNASDDEPCANATLKVAMDYSCNTVFGKIGADLGGEKMRTQAERFGFNNPGINVPIRASESFFPSKSSADGTAMDSIGQHDTRATPLQMAMVAAAIANDGRLMAPYMVDEERASNLTTISKHSERQLSQAVSPATAQKLQQLMESVVQNGTGKKAQIDGLKVGGKTGTAQHGENNAGLPFAWFMSYAKAPDGRQVAVAVVVEDGSSERDQISGGGLAAPIAKALMKAALDR